MKTQHVFSASAAAVLAMTMAAFAQAPPPSPSAAQPTKSTSPATRVTLVGCLMSENDYRRAKDSGRGGPLGTGLGSGDEFVLVNASKVAPAATPSSIECGTAAAGEAYELSGNREKELAKHVGRFVEITGMLKEAKTTTAPGGEAKPTGGFDPLRRDLKLFEVEVASFRELPTGQSSGAAPPPAAAERPAAPAPQPPPAPARPEPASPSTAPRQQLPRTASPLPLTGLIGMLSLAAGLALRRRG